MTNSYELKKVANGWVVGSQQHYFTNLESDRPLDQTYAPTLGEAFEIVRKHVKENK